MNKDDLIKKLSSLIILDLDAYHAYGHVIAHVEAPEVKRELISFQKDHERHMDELSAAIVQLGGEPPARKRDVKGYLIETYTALRSLIGAQGPLKALRNDERMTVSVYEEAALMTEAPENIKAILARNWSDEKRHLAYIEGVLSN